MRFDNIPNQVISILTLNDRLDRPKIKKFIFEDNFKKYNEFLQNTPNLILLGLGGSYAYGTNIEESDIDLRGIYVNPLNELVGTYPDSEQHQNPELDITIYSMKKMFKLLAACNPNTIEILGLRDEDYLYMHHIGIYFASQADEFLSKRAIGSFGNYALSQLNRLVNRSGRVNEEIIANEQRSLKKVISDLRGRYKDYIDYIDIVDDKDEIIINMKYDKIPIEKMNAIMQELTNVHREYKRSDRNDKAIAHNKLSKHMMHLLRLYMMGIDILKDGIIKTYREDEHDLLMSIRNGDYLTGENKTVPTEEFNKLLEDYKAKFDEAARNTKLPDQPDWKKLNQLHMEIVGMYYT